jgi:hypothetical protein
MVAAATNTAPPTIHRPVRSQLSSIRNEESYHRRHFDADAGRNRRLSPNYRQAISVV